MQLREAMWLAYAHVGDISAELGDKSATLQNYRKGLALMQDLAGKNPTNLQLQAKLSDSMTGLGLLLAKDGNTNDGAAMFSRGLQILKMLADRREATARNQIDYVQTLLICDPGGRCDAAAALPYATRAVQITNNSDPDCLDLLATVYSKTGDAAKAVDMETKALQLLQSGAEPTDAAKRRQFEVSLANFKKALVHPQK